MEYARPGVPMKFPARCVGGRGQDAQIDKNGRFVLSEAWAKIGRKGFWHSRATLPDLSNVVLFLLKK